MSFITENLNAVQGDGGSKKDSSTTSYKATAADERWLYFEKFEISPIQIIFSFANVSAAERDRYMHLV